MNKHLLGKHLLGIFACLPLSFGCLEGATDVSEPDPQSEAAAAPTSKHGAAQRSAAPSTPPAQSLVRCSSAPSPNLGDVLAVDDAHLQDGHATLAALAAIEFPTDLDFRPENSAEAKKQFTAFLKSLTKTSRQAHEQYLVVVNSEAPLATRKLACDGIVAASAWVAHQFETAAVPVWITNHPEYAIDMRRAYCDAISGQAKPIRQSIAEWNKRCEALR